MNGALHVLRSFAPYSLIEFAVTLADLHSHSGPAVTIALAGEVAAKTLKSSWWTRQDQ